MQVETHDDTTTMLEHWIGSLALVLSFIGGAIGALSATPKLTLQINDPQIWDFLVRSLIGGTIGLGVKVFGDLIVHRIKSRKKSNEENDANENRG